jgi:hypothetical protein
MSTDRATLERECQVFTRHIARMSPTPYVIGKYVEAHRVSPAFVAAERLEQWLVAAARFGPAVTRLADAYARLFAPRGVLRKKLVLLLAILETSAPFHRAIDHEPPRQLLAAMLHLAVTGLAGALAALVGVMVFVPLRIIARLGRPSA